MGKDLSKYFAEKERERDHGCGFEASGGWHSHIDNVCDAWPND